MNILPERMCRNEKAYGFDAESAAAVHAVHQRIRKKETPKEELKMKIQRYPLSGRR